MFSDNLKSVREKSGISQAALAKVLNVSQGTIGNWETGKRTPDAEMLKTISKYFRITVDELIGNDREISNIRDVIPQDKVHMIPVYATVSAGFGAYAEDNIIDHLPMIIDNPYDVADTIGIRVKGDSMYPKIEDGDIIIVRKQESVDSGSVAVLLLDGEEGLVKKVEYGKDWIELHSFNPEYKTRRFEGADVLRLRVVGKVLKVVKSI
mgnify:CR=1 FL=1